MDHARAVQRRDTLCELPSPIAYSSMTALSRASDGYREVRYEVGSGHPLHREKAELIGCEQLVQADQVRMHDVRERAKLRLETVLILRTYVVHALERHIVLQELIEHLVI